MSQHENETKELFGKVQWDDKPDERHREALQQRCLEVLAARQPSARAEIWRTIMTSRMTKAAAVLMVVALAAVFAWKSQNSQTPSTLDLFTRSAAAESIMFGKGLMHFVNEITLYPGAASDAGKLLTDLEADATYEKNVAFMKSWLSQKQVPLAVLNEKGHIVWYDLNVAATADKPIVVTDEVWFDSASGRFARVMKSEGKVLLANAWDGQAVYTTSKAADGSLKVVRNEMKEGWKAPENPADFMGLSAGIKGSIAADHYPPVQDVTTVTAADGSQQRVYKLGYVDAWKKLDTYFLFKVDAGTNVIDQVDCVVDGKTTRVHKRVSADEAQSPTVGWDLATLPAEKPAGNPEVTASRGAYGMTIAQMAQQATYPVYVFAARPGWTDASRVFSLPDMADQKSRMYAVTYRATDGRDVVLTEGKTFERYFGAMLKAIEAANEQIHWYYQSPNGFCVMHQKDSTTEKWWTELALKSSGFTPSEKRVGYILMSPAKDFMVLAVNGPVSDEELHTLVDNLILAADYTEAPKQ
jgi:hypothetical protein